MTTKFEAGKTYTHGWIGDADLKTNITILKRTEKFVWMKVHDKEVRRGVYVYGGVEQVKPYGTYSMCSILSADKPAA